MFKNINLKKVFFQFLFIILISFLFLLNDFIFKFFSELNKAEFSFKVFFLVFVLSTILSIIKNKKIIYVTLSILCFMEITQLVYLAYFGAYLHPAIIGLIFKEIFEIQETGFSSFGKVYFGFLSVLIPYFLLFLLFKKYHEKFYTVKYSWILLIIYMSILPIKSIKYETIAESSGNPRDASLYNSLKVYSGYLFNILPESIGKDNKETFEKYEIEKLKINNKKLNVVLVYGESFNYYNQGLFGYNKNTTPRLSKLAKNDKNFIYKKSISGAISTRSSIPMFFNLQREAKNYKMQIEMELNLFKLAKEQGFKTFFISAQSSGLTNNLGRQYIDVFITKDDRKKTFEDKKDEGLLEILKEQELSDKNFIVLHQRNLHSPYAKNYKHRNEEFNKFDFDYDNAVLYNDYLLSEFLNYFKKTLKTPFYFFATSDHGELTGQKGLSGHIILLPECADVPIYAYSNIKNQTINTKLAQTFRPTHYELGILIAETLGYKITNPNLVKGTYYINGNDPMARLGYITLTKDYKNKKIDYKIIEKN